MSIYFDFEVGPGGRRFRRAVQEDEADIQLFLNKEDTDTLFCKQEIDALIELSALSIVLMDEDKNVAGFMALSDHVPLPAIDPGAWEIWMRNMFRKYYLPRNTLFIHFMCYKPEESEYFLEEAVLSVFMNDAYLHHIILVVPPTCKVDVMTKYPIFKKRTMFRQCSASTSEEATGCLHLLVAEREDFIPKLKVRRAVEEDNDEVVEILDNQCRRLVDLYGDYYVSELLSRHPEMKRTFIVAQDENHDTLVGVMCLNEEVNYKELQKTYELGPYCGLVKTNAFEKEQIKRENTLLKTFGDPIMNGQWSPFTKIEKDSVTYSEVKVKRETKDDQVPRDKSTREVNFTKAPDQKEEAVKSSTESLSPMLGRDLSLVLLMDDEPLDYEIVNIDTQLIMPDFSNSRESLPKLTRSNLSFHMEKKKPKVKQRPKCEEKYHYEGGPNAFIIELFGLRDDIDGRRAFDLLEAAFESMPKYEYCLMRVPTSDHAFPLLQHFCFVPTKPDTDCKYALYIAHRNSVIGKFRVRKVTYSDIPQVCHFLHNINAKETIYTIEERIVNREYMAYMMLSGMSIIGIGILDKPQQIDVVRARFVLDRHVRLAPHVSSRGPHDCISTVQSVLIPPTFEPHFKFFAREMMRMSGSNILLWLTAYRNKMVAHKTNGILTAMNPLSFRVTSESGLMPHLKRLYELSKSLLSFSGWIMSKKSTSIAKQNITCRLVIVGGSRTAIAFLTHLLFTDTSSYLTYTNITLVSKHGLPSLRHPTPAAELMFPRCSKSSDRFLKSMPFTYYVNTVRATMVDINKQEKCIITHRGEKIFYDKLFLLIGKQYQHPDYLKDLTELERSIKMGYSPPYVRMDDPHYLQTLPATRYNTPLNVFFINDISGAHQALKYVKTLRYRYDSYKVCVYGANIEAYCCVSALLYDGLEPEDLVFVEPFPWEDKTKPRVSVFANRKVDETIAEYLSSLRVSTHRGYTFHSWRCEERVLTSAQFVSHHHLLDVECHAFFYYGKKYINSHAFVAINKCGLAYDGGVLIDHEFRTKDPHVYSAGPGTRYYRRYSADNMSQKFYDSYEIGKMLAIQIKNQLDPLFKERKTLTRPSFSADSISLNDEYKGQLPKLTSPKVKSCLLLGGLQYLDVRPPGCQNPHYYILSQSYAGSVFETFKSGYFKLHLNKHLVVDGITCITPKHRNIEHFKLLYGLSASTLNNVHLRFVHNRITDFYEYFKAPWTYYIFNERSEEMLTMIKHLKPKNDPFGKTLEEVLRDISKDLKDEQSAIKAHMTVHSYFESSQYYDAMIDYIVNWLSDHDLVLSTFIMPGNTLEFTYDIEQNPAFMRRKKTIRKMLQMVA